LLNAHCSILQEEFEKREQLEELKESLEQLLQQEQVKSSELEERRRQQERMLAEEQERLEKLEQERQMRDQQYEASSSECYIVNATLLISHFPLSVGL